MKIAVYSPNWIGDAVMALPFLTELKNQHQNSKIYLICKDWVSGIYNNHPAIDEIITIRRNILSSFIGTLKTGYELRSRNFDEFYTLTDSFRSALISWISGSTRRFGFKSQMRSILLTNSIEIPSHRLHRSKKYLRMLKNANTPITKPELYVNDKEKEWAKNELKKLQLNNPVALFPFSVASARTIPDNIIRKWVNNSKKDYLVFGSKNDLERGNELIKTCNGLSIKSICGRYSLRKSIALISICNYTLATDSGLGHISAALGIPTISFFGPGIPTVTGPLSAKTNIIKHCYPCMGDLCNKNDEQIKCLKQISKSDIEVAVNSFPKL